MKLLHKYFIYSCKKNPNKIKILLKKCKHILSNNKNLSINNNNKITENDNKNITFLFISLMYTYLIQQKIAISINSYMLVPGNGRLQKKY